MFQRIELAKVAKIELIKNAKREERVRHVEKCLDFTQVRILTPLPLTTIILTILLLALHFDGFNIDIWICFVPLFFFFFYLSLSIIAVALVYNYQFDSSSVFRGLWTNMRGPVRVMFGDMLGSSNFLAGVAVFVLVLCVLEAILVAVKLSPDDLVPVSVISTLPWGLVFLPIWCLFAVFCTVPFTKCISEGSVFILGVVLFWIPLFILFVCLTVKLDGEDNNTKAGSMRLALIFMPFWVIEAFFMTASLAFLLFGIHRLRAGLLDRIDEHLGLFFSSWCILAPFALFQAFLSVRDDELSGAKGNISVADSVAAILIILCWLFVCSIVFVCRFRTPFQVARDASDREAAGVVELYEV